MTHIKNCTLKPLPFSVSLSSVFTFSSASFPLSVLLSLLVTAPDMILTPIFYIQAILFNQKIFPNLKVRLKTQLRKFPGSPVVRTQCYYCQGLGLIPSRGTKIP